MASRGMTEAHREQLIATALSRYLAWLICLPVEKLNSVDPLTLSQKKEGLNPNFAAAYLNMQRRINGLPPIPWKEVEWTPPQTARRQTHPEFCPGERCPHGRGFGAWCDECRGPIMENPYE